MNKITGWFNYNNVICSQHEEVGEKLNTLFTNTKPAQILEIGTASGGLTLLLRDLLDELDMESTSLRTYDINPDFNRRVLLERIEDGTRIDFRLKNIFNHPYSELIEVDEVSKFIQRDGTTIVMCDGGSKKNEFRILAPFLKQGDIIMAHDYAPNEEYFKEHIKDKIWNWLEIQDEDIETVCVENDLVPFMQEEFLKVVWVSKIKRS